MDDERFDFENLKVYQKALEYVDFVYAITKDFPKTEIRQSALDIATLKRSKNEAFCSEHGWRSHVRQCNSDVDYRHRRRCAETQQCLAALLQLP